MYYEIIKFVKVLSETEVQQLLMAWDRCGIAILPELNVTNFSKGCFYIDPYRR